MPKTKLFPSGIALGSAFCNREKEREYLAIVPDPCEIAQDQLDA